MPLSLVCLQSIDSEVEIDGDSTVEGENVSDGGKQSTETETSVMRAGYQDSLEEEMGLYESLPFLPYVSSHRAEFSLKLSKNGCYCLALPFLYVQIWYRRQGFLSAKS